MKRILFFFFLINSLFIKSQTILSDSVSGINCYHDGSIILSITNINQFTLEWYYEDDSLGWIAADTISDTFFNINGDSIFTQRCGNFRLDIINSFSVVVTSKLFWVGCKLGINASHKNVKCFGDSTGELKRISHSGSSPYFYEWFKNGVTFSSGNNDTLHINLITGTYKVIITDSIGCQDSVISIISSPSLLNIDSVNASDINCRGANTGSVSYSVSGGKQYVASEFYNYYLIDGSDTIASSDVNGSSPSFSSVLNPYQITFDSLYAGEYIVSAVDSFGCTLNDTFTIIEPLPYTTFASTTFPLICESDSGYLKIDSVLGGGNIIYGFMGLNTDSIYVQSGWYQMYIEDLDYGCIDTVPVRCYAQYEIEVFSTIINNSCFGDASGAVVIDSIIGGNLPYDVQWGGLNSAALFANTYAVLIVDSIGCVHEEEFILTQPNVTNPNAVLIPPSCYGLSDGSITINLSGGTGNLNYYWLNGTGTADSLYGLDSGIYTLVVSDSLMCVDSFAVHLPEPDSLIITFSNFEGSLACNGAVTVLNLLISGGTGPFDIMWSDGFTTAQRIFGAGNYFCTVTDVNGCIASDSLVITEPDLLTIDLTYSAITCDEGGAASISVNGGVAPISILWNNGDTTQIIDSLWGTTYWVIVTDSCGNSASDTFELFPYILETSVFYDDSSHVGEVEVDTCSSVGTFTYQWIDILGNVISNTEFSAHLCEGTYFVTTTDNISNCSVTDTLIAIYYLPNGIVDVSTTTVFADADLWGNPPYSYFWDNAEILAHANVCPGSHWVEVSDNDGCIVRADFDIDPLLIALDPADLIIECNLENLDVEITADATGGTEPYTYAWSNGSTENSINLSLSPGNYIVTVMDNNSCTEDTVFIIATMTAECIPNVFTPNGDNVNDTWSLEDTFLYSDSEVRIYGRYGKLMFQSVGYDRPWDGKNEKGNDVPDGAYFYSIEIGHNFDAIKGSVTILR